MASDPIQIDSLSDGMRRAAMLVADGRLTNDQIAADAGVSRSTLAKWKLSQGFRDEVERLRVAVRDELQTGGIALKVNRMKALHGLHLRLEQIIEERAADPAMRNIPGGETGLIKRTVKNVGTAAKPKIIEIGEIDFVLIRQYLAIINQASMEDTPGLERQAQ